MKKNKLNILITGGMGYAGSKICQFLSNNKKLNITVIDKLIHTGVDKKIIPESIEFCKLDINNYKELSKFFINRKFDIIIHLAAIVGDPASRKYPNLTKKTNLISSKKLFKLCAKNKVKKFIFFSTCSNYGLSSSNKLLNENSKLKPLSLYAKTKVEFEKFLLCDKSDISKIILRISTLFGVSPRMRYDLTINEFTKMLFLKKKLDVFDPLTWRPYIHIQDLAEIVNFFLNKKFGNVSRVFNIGIKGSNYTKKDICDEIIRQMPSRAKFIFYLKDQSKDKRNYKVNFNKIHKYKIKNNFNLKKGIYEIISDLKSNKGRRKFKKIFSNI